MGTVAAVACLVMVMTDMITLHLCTYSNILEAVLVARQGSPVARKVNQVPGVVDEEVVDAARLACTEGLT